MGPPSTSMIGVGVLGFGHWGPNLVRNLQVTTGARVVALADPDHERARLAALALPGVAVSADPDDVLGATAVDAVIIATPLAGHYPLAHAALRAGKHVLVEKPFTATSDQAARLVELAASAKRVLMVDHPCVYSGAMATMRRLVDGGGIGDLYYYDSVRISPGRFRAGEDVLWDLAVHDLGCLDVMRPQPPVAVSATGGHPAGAPGSIAYLSLFYDDGAIAHIHASWLSPLKVRRILLGGSRGQLAFDDLEPEEKVRLYQGGHDTTPHFDPTEPLLLALGEFIRCIDQDEVPLTDGEAGYRAVRLLEDASCSLAARGRPVDVRP